MRTAKGERAQKARKRRQERIHAFDRYVDCSVIIRVVVSDPDGDIETPNGLRVREVRRHYRGCVFDTKSSPPRMMPGRWAGPDADPLVWLVSEDQEPIVLHGDEMPRGIVAIGSMGAGKTTALAMWHFLRWIENACERREGLQTAPTLERLGLVRAEIDKIWRPNWMRWVDRIDFTGYELCDGSKLRFVSTYRQSAAQGSRVQGFNASWAGRDETQDQVEEHEHIEARGRAAKFGGTYYKQLGTATVKDSPDWRTLLDRLKQAIGADGKPLWIIVHIMGSRSPFISAAYWEALRASMSPNLYARIVLCKDDASEARLYPTWDRARNLRPVPLIGARHITSIVLRAKTGNPLHNMLIGHDPGAAKAASIFLEAYQMPGERLPWWWVRAELFTLHESTEQHATKALLVAQRLGRNRGAECAHVRALPHGHGIDKPDEDVYRIWKRVGFDIKAAQYRTDGTGTGIIDVESRIEMVRHLLRSADDKSRLFVDCDEFRKPCAPKLVEALETLERDDKGRPVRDKRLAYDKSDPADALGYALWPWEKEAASSVRAAVAQAARQ